MVIEGDSESNITATPANVSLLRVRLLSDLKDSLEDSSREFLEDSRILFLFLSLSLSLIIIITTPITSSDLGEVPEEGE
jgi:hypothetical protein